MSEYPSTRRTILESFLRHGLLNDDTHYDLVLIADDLIDQLLLPQFAPTKETS